MSSKFFIYQAFGLIEICWSFSSWKTDRIAKFNSNNKKNVFRQLCIPSISGAGTAYPSGAPEFTASFSGVGVARSLVYCVVLCRSLFVLFILTIVSVFLPILITPSSTSYLRFSLKFTTVCCNGGSVTIDSGDSCNYSISLPCNG